MGKLIPVRYGYYNYPKDIVSKLVETAGHFDKEKLRYQTQSYSLHTEYSYGARKWNSSLINKYQELLNAQKGGVPKLWYSKEWAREFAKYIVDMVGENFPPTIIEIHPPFRDYCKNIEEFLDIYEHFEEVINNIYPNTHILIENRFGSMYEAEFLISQVNELRCLIEEVEKRKLKLKIALDLPQLLNAHGIFQNEVEEAMKEVLREVYRIRKYIGGIHLWGSTGRKKHIGDLDTLFNTNKDKKSLFLDCIAKIFIREDVQDIYFVPEVNPNKWDDINAKQEVENNIASIIKDLKLVGFEFL